MSLPETGTGLEVENEPIKTQEEQKDLEDENHEQEQNKLYEKALEHNASQDLKISPTPPQTKSRLHANKRPVSARSTTFQATNPLKRSQSAMSNLHDPYLRSSNDFKYLGDQFAVGKLDPKLLPNHEIRFQRLHSPRLKKLRSDTSNSKDLFQTFSQFKQSKDMRLFDKTESKFLTNDFKFIGDQFKVGRVDPKIESPVEKRFKRLFNDRLKRLHPDESKAPIPLTYAELKELHILRSIPKVK